MTKRKRKDVVEVESPISIDGSDSEPVRVPAFSLYQVSSSKVDCDAAVSYKTKELDTETFEHYLGRILSKDFSKQRKVSFAFLDSLWFSLYMKKQTKEEVLQWVKNKKILSKKYVVIPIVCWRHWSLLILCNLGQNSESKTRKRCMLLLDSLQMAGPKRLEPHIRKFVMDIYEVDKKPEKKAMFSKIPLLVPKVPQQRNKEECGHFVLYFLKLFVQNAPTNFAEDGYPYFMKEDWFCHEDVDSFCSELSQA